MVSAAAPWEDASIVSRLSVDGQKRIDPIALVQYLDPTSISRVPSLNARR